MAHKIRHLRKKLRNLDRWRAKVREQLTRSLIRKRLSNGLPVITETGNLKDMLKWCANLNLKHREACIRTYNHVEFSGGDIYKYEGITNLDKNIELKDMPEDYAYGTISSNHCLEYYSDDDNGCSGYREIVEVWSGDKNELPCCFGPDGKLRTIVTYQRIEYDSHYFVSDYKDLGDLDLIRKDWENRPEKDRSGEYIDKNYISKYNACRYRLLQGFSIIVASEKVENMLKSFGDLPLTYRTAFVRVKKEYMFYPTTTNFSILNLDKSFGLHHGPVGYVWGTVDVKQVVTAKYDVGYGGNTWSHYSSTCIDNNEYFEVAEVWIDNNPNSANRNRNDISDLELLFYGEANQPRCFDADGKLSGIVTFQQVSRNISGMHNNTETQQTVFHVSNYCDLSNDKLTDIKWEYPPAADSMESNGRTRSTAAEYIQHIDPKASAANDIVARFGSKEDEESDEFEEENDNEGSEPEDME